MLPSFLKPYHTNFSNLIRIGRKSDRNGGYVIDRRVINKTSVIITCGLEAEWSFEKEFQKKNSKCKILAFDHTVNKKFWIKRFKKDFISFLLLKRIMPNQIINVFKYLELKIFLVVLNYHYFNSNFSTK